MKSTVIITYYFFYKPSTFFAKFTFFSQSLDRIHVLFRDLSEKFALLVVFWRNFRFYHCLLTKISVISRTFDEISVFYAFYYILFVSDNIRIFFVQHTAFFRVPLTNVMSFSGSYDKIPLFMRCFDEILVFSVTFWQNLCLSHFSDSCI